MPAATTTTTSSSHVDYEPRNPLSSSVSYNVSAAPPVPMPMPTDATPPRAAESPVVETEPKDKAVEKPASTPETSRNSKPVAEARPETPKAVPADSKPAHLSQPALDDVREALRRIDYVSRELWLKLGRALYEWDAVQGRNAFLEWTTNQIMLRPGEPEDPFGWKDIPDAWQKFENDTTPPPCKIDFLFTWASISTPGDDYEVPSASAAVARNYHYVESRGYFRKLTAGRWQQLTPDQMRRELKAKHNVESKCEKFESANPIEKVIWEIETNRQVDGIAPFVFNKRDIVTYHGQRFLNSSTVTCVFPLAKTKEWGEGFPFIAKLFDQMFDENAKKHVVAWLAHAYTNALEGEPNKGTALFLLGPSSRGKTLTSNVLVGGLLGGHAEASSFLMNESRFNEQLFEVPLWCVDDSLAASDHHAHNRFSGMLKKFNANHEFEMEGKHKKPVKLPWYGRLIVTANLDAESARIIPNMEMSNRDKISLVKLRDDAPVIEETAPDKLIRSELSAFAGYLLGYEIPQAVHDNRFGVKAYHDPELLDLAQQDNVNQPFEELVDEWRREFFLSPDYIAGLDETERNDYGKGRRAQPFTELTSTTLYEEMCDCPAVAKTASRQKVSYLGRNLTRLASSREWVEKRKKDGRSVYKILNPYTASASGADDSVTPIQ
jgi:hypothetical protein